LGSRKEAASNFLIDDLDFGATDEESKGDARADRHEDEEERVPHMF